MVFDWITREIEKNERTGIQCTLTEQLEDLDIADDATHNQMKRKTEKLGMDLGPYNQCGPQGSSL